MKIAIATRNQETVTAHYGKAPGFVVYEFRDGRMVDRLYREKRRSGPGADSHGHQGGGGRAAAALIADCDVVVAGGMGRRAARHLDAAGVGVILTDEQSVEDAARRCAAGDLPHLEERFHDADHDSPQGGRAISLDEPRPRRSPPPKTG